MESIEAITQFLFVQTEPLMPADLTIVLGNDYVFTMNNVYQLLHKGLLTGSLILTGHSAQGNGVPEAEHLFKAGLALGIPRERMLLECRATNSYENMLFSKQIIQEQLGGFDAFQRISVVGKAFVLRRIEMTAHRLNYPMEKLQYIPTVDREGLNIAADCWWKTAPARKRVFEELSRIGNYLAKGDLSL